MSKPEIRIGIGGWTFPPWRGAFYPAGLPQKDELNYASRHLTTIEINGTYYGSQKPASFTKWHDETPEDFVFAVKGPRFTTNRRVLAESADSIERFFTSGVLELKDKLGPINWQFMPTKTFDPGDFEKFLQNLPQNIDGRPIQHAVEVRHESFQTPDFVTLARQYNVAVVIAGDCEYPQIADITAPFVYLRLMGTTESEPSGYSTAALKTWATRIKTWSTGATPKDVTLLTPASKNASPRKIHAYIISGHKVSNPAAAMALSAQFTP